MDCKTIDYKYGISQLQMKRDLALEVELLIIVDTDDGLLNYCTWNHTILEPPSR